MHLLRDSPQGRHGVSLRRIFQATMSKRLRRFVGFGRIAMNAYHDASLTEKISM